MAKGPVEESSGRTAGPGRPPAKPNMMGDFFRPTRMNPALYMMSFILHSLPDPDEVMAKGDLHYQDLANLIRDAHVLSCVQQRKSATLSHRIRIEPRPDSSGPLAEKALNACRRMVSLWSQGTSDTISQILEALFMGMQPFELNWFWDGLADALIVERPQDLLQEWFRYTPDGVLRYRPKPWVFITEPVPSFKVLMARNMATLRNPYGVKIWSSCYWPTVFKRSGMKFFAEYVERFGMPTLEVQAPANVDPDELRKYVKEVIAMARLGVIAHKGEYKIDMQDMSTKYQTTDAFDKFMQQMDRENSKAILAQTLTTEEGGSRSQGDIHKQILETLWAGDDTFVARALTDLFDIVTFVNFGPDVVGPQALVGEQMGRDRLERDAKLRDMLGVDFTDEYICRNYDLKPGDFARTLPLKASYSDTDPALQPTKRTPSGAPAADTDWELRHDLIPPAGASRASGRKGSREPDSRVSPKQGGSRKSDAAASKTEARNNHRNRSNE